MATIVEISAVETTIHCDEKGNAEQKITIHNTSGRELRLGARVRIDSPGKSEWVGSIVQSDRKKATEWELGANDTIQLSIPIKAEGAPEGQYGFRVEVYSTDAPGEEYAISNMLAFKVSGKKVEPVKVAKEVKKPFPVWIIAVIVGVLVVVGGGVAWFMTGEDTRVPDVVSMPFHKAKAALKKHNLTPGTVTKQLTGNQPVGTVISQKPEANTEVEKGSKIELVIEDGSVSVPKLAGKTPAQAQEILASVNLVLDPKIAQKRTGQAQEGTVIEQSPQAGQKVRSETAVAVTVEEKDIQVPSVVGQTRKDATSILASQGLKVGDISERRAGGTPGVVLSQNPPANSQVASGTAVGLVVECTPKNIIIKVTDKTVTFERQTSWETCSGYRTVFQGDGNLVVFNPSNKPVWDSHTDGKGTILAMQADGNLVIYAPGGKAVWHSNTYGNPGSSLAFQEDGNLVIFNRNSKPIWNTRTNGK